MKLRDLFKGTPVTPKRTETPEWHPLDELEPALDEQLMGHRFDEWPHEVVAEVVSAQCTAPTKTGKPCSKPPRPGSDRCNLPAHQRT